MKRSGEPDGRSVRQRTAEIPTVTGTEWALRQYADEVFFGGGSFDYRLSRHIPPYVLLPPQTWNSLGYPATETSVVRRYNYIAMQRDIRHLINLNSTLFHAITDSRFVRSAVVPRVFWEFMHPAQRMSSSRVATQDLPRPIPMRILRYLFYQCGCHIDQLLYCEWLRRHRTVDWEEMGVAWSNLRPATAFRLVAAA